MYQVTSLNKDERTLVNLKRAFSAHLQQASTEELLQLKQLLHTRREEIVDLFLDLLKQEPQRSPVAALPQLVQHFPFFGTEVGRGRLGLVLQA